MTTSSQSAVRAAVGVMVARARRTLAPIPYKAPSAAVPTNGAPVPRDPACPWIVMS